MIASNIPKEKCSGLQNLINDCIKHSSGKNAVVRAKGPEMKRGLLVLKDLMNRQIINN